MHTQRASTAALVLALSIVGTERLTAQRGNVVGIVHDTAGRPIPQATVVLEPEHRARADSNGRFVFADVKAGLHALRIRRIGFRPYDAEIRIHGDARDTIRAEMEAGPSRMPTVVTRAERMCSRYKYEGVWCREKDGKGLVFTVEELDQEQPEYIADLLKGVPGLRVDFGIRGGWQARFPRGLGRCVKTLLNGRDSLVGFNPWTNFAVDDIAGLEVFQPREVPPEYRHDASGRGGERCILINIWTWNTLDS
jgi:hypothetical protein